MIVTLLSAAACFAVRPSKGGGQITAAAADQAARQDPDASDVAVPPGYRIELVADGLTFPTGVAFGDGGEVYVVEAGYSYGPVRATPRILEIRRGAAPRVVHAGDSHAPWNGLDVDGGAFYVAQGGHYERGRVVRIEGDDVTVLVDGLPSQGDHHTNGPVVVDGWVYFGQGTVTNAAVVGVDNHAYGWLARHPDLRDIPCRDVTLAGTSFTSANPLTEADDEVTTGAFKPFGQPARAGERVAGAVPCSGAVMRVPTGGGDVELVAWGMRNPFGLARGPGGALYVSDNGYDVRGSRPVFGAADPLWRVTPGEVTWHGWPDHSEGRPLTMDFYGEADGDPKGFVLAEHPGLPPEPVAMLPVHASANGLDVAPAAFGHEGEVFIALFGDMAPTVGKVSAPVGFKVVRVDPATGVVAEFARNRAGDRGPASRVGGEGLERPIAVRFDPAGTSLYVVDFGILRMSDAGPAPEPGTGRLWRITREATDAR